MLLIFVPFTSIKLVSTSWISAKSQRDLLPRSFHCHVSIVRNAVKNSNITFSFLEKIFKIICNKLQQLYTNTHIFKTRPSALGMSDPVLEFLEISRNYNQFSDQMHWWCAEDSLMMRWWCAKDALMMHWWCTDDTVWMQSWCADDAQMMQWWCTDDALIMR